MGFEKFDFCTYNRISYDNLKKQIIQHFINYITSILYFSYRIDSVRVTEILKTNKNLSLAHNLMRVDIFRS